MGVKKRARKAWSNQAGQMTVELAVAFPVVVAVAVIAMNALLFLSECATRCVSMRRLPPTAKGSSRAVPRCRRPSRRGRTGRIFRPALPLRTEGRDG